MADSNFRGPVNSMGALEANAATASVEPLDGPSSFYQGISQPDLRSNSFAKDGFRPGQQAEFLTGNTIVVCDAIPQARSSTLIGAAQVATGIASTVLLATAQVGAAAGSVNAAAIAIGVPIIPLGTTVATFANIALDFGFCTGTTTTNSSTVVVTDSSQFRAGQWIVIGGVGNASASRSLVTQVQSAAVSSTSITVLPAPVTGIVNVPIGQANLWGSAMLPTGTPFGPSTAAANAHAYGGAWEGGLGRIYNPREMLSRTITVQTANDIASSYSAVVSGWDLWGNPMTEIIAQSATTFSGKKAFKYISSIVLGTSQAAGTSFAYGIGDTFGLPIRADYWEQVEVTWNAAAMTNSNGFTSALPTNAAQNGTTRDVRGLIAVSTAVMTGAIATGISAVPTNGTGRLWVALTIPPQQAILATPVNTVPMFGVAQSTATT